MGIMKRRQWREKKKGREENEHLKPREVVLFQFSGACAVRVLGRPDISCSRPLPESPRWDARATVQWTRWVETSLLSFCLSLCIHFLRGVVGEDQPVLWVALGKRKTWAPREMVWGWSDWSQQALTWLCVRQGSAGGWGLIWAADGETPPFLVEGASVGVAACSN